MDSMVQLQPCSRPIFVLGAPRSGAHELAVALAQHSHLATHNASEFLYPLFGSNQVSDLFRGLHQRLLPTYVGMHRVDAPEFLRSIGLGVNSLFTSRNPGKRWIDSTPEYTLIADTLATMFPDAVFLHLVRDGRRAVAAMTSFLDRFSDDRRAGWLKTGLLPRWMTDFRTACETWRQYTEAGTRFASQQPTRCRTVQHHELTADPARELRRLFDFLSVSAEDRPISHFRTNELPEHSQRFVFDPPPTERLAGPLVRWGRDEVQFFIDQVAHRDPGFLREWTPDQRAIFAEVAGPTLIAGGWSTRPELDQWREGQGGAALAVDGATAKTVARPADLAPAVDGDALIEVKDLLLAPRDAEQLSGFALESPRPGTRGDTYALKISGWVLGGHAAATAVEVRIQEILIRRILVRIPRRDLKPHFPEAKGIEAAGFAALVGVAGLPPAFELHLHAVLQNESRAPLGIIRARHQPIRSAFQPTLQPLMVTSLARTGTTWLMRLLAEHPRIVAHRVYPYETRSAGYWVHLFKILSEPANHAQSAHPDTFLANLWWAGHHPAHTEPMSRHPQLGPWFGRRYPEQLAEFCQRSTEEFYLQVAQSQGQTEPLYFAEKYTSGPVPWLTWDLYPKGREVFLVRDFRDVVCSILAFNAKRGFEAFGRNRVTSDEEYVYRLHVNYRRLLAHYQSRTDRAYLVRYEDLVARPLETLAGLMRYLSLEESPASLEALHNRASEETAELKKHKTSQSPAASIGRWRRDLSPSLQAVCLHAAGDVMKEFGYTAL
jgi:hypothetical protein